MFDIYLASDNNRQRFLLGREGSRMLLVLGLNPSTADQFSSDITASKVEKIAEQAGFSGFVICNLYPCRCTDPQALPKRQQRAQSLANIAAINKAAGMLPIAGVWAAWGQNIELRPYLRANCQAIHAALAGRDLPWFHYGELSKAGHPRHPSRAAYGWELKPFAIERYVNFEA